MRLNVAVGLLGLLAGLAIAFLAGASERQAFAQGAAADGSMLMTAANFNNGQEDYVWVIDGSTKRMSCYKYKNNGIELLGTRNLKYEMQLEEFTYAGKHVKPSDIRKELEKKQEEEKKK
jgi:hypothetical protein